MLLVQQPPRFSGAGSRCSRGGELMPGCGCREPYAAERILSFIEENTPPEELARIRAQAMLAVTDMVAEENRARLAKLPPVTWTWPTKAVALALIARGYDIDAYQHLLAADVEPDAAASFVQHALARVNLPMRPCGLPVEKIARMQLTAGEPEAAMHTLVANGWPPARAADFLRGPQAPMLGADAPDAPAPASGSPAIPLLVATAFAVGGLLYVTRRR
jgi:hypothetical protein